MRLALSFALLLLAAALPACRRGSAPAPPAPPAPALSRLGGVDDCCRSDGDCPSASPRCAAGRCLPRPGPGRCWSDRDCPTGHPCVGAWLCPCGHGCGARGAEPGRCVAAAGGEGRSDGG